MKNVRVQRGLFQRIGAGIALFSLFFSFFVFALTLQLQQVHAVEPTDSNAVPYKIVPKGNLFAPSTSGFSQTGDTPIGYTQNNILTFLPKNGIDLIFGFFTTIGSIVVLVSGTKIIFAKGDVKKVQEGIQIVIYTIVGMVIIGSSWFVIRLILDINFGG